jgi:hypothetical protein
LDFGPFCLRARFFATLSSSASAALFLSSSPSASHLFLTSSLPSRQDGMMVLLLLLVAVVCCEVVVVMMRCWWCGLELWLQEKSCASERARGAVIVIVVGPTFSFARKGTLTRKERLLSLSEGRSDSLWLVREAARERKRKRAQLQASLFALVGIGWKTI